MAGIFVREDIHCYITSSLAHGRPEDLAFYTFLDEKTKLLKKFSPNWLTGPEIGIYQLND